MSKSIFTKIIDREIPAAIVYEDDKVIAFLDINPINKGHTLIVPKEAFENIYDGSPENLGYLMQVAKKVSLAVAKAMDADGVNIIMNNNESAGQEVFHAHLHVIPRFKDDQAFPTPKHDAYEEDEEALVATQIQAAIED